MHQEIEIEFKQLLTEKEYTQLVNAFFLEEAKPFTQTNHYFDTKDFILKENGSALRIRQKQTGFVLTLKQPHEAGLLETHQQLQEEEAIETLATGIIPAGDVLTQLRSFLPVQSTSFTFLGSLTTERMEKKVNAGLLVLDKSTYLDITDYELEFECRDEKRGKAAFDNIITTYNIREKKTLNKIRRFYERKRMITNENETDERGDESSE
ncbi:CYTH domain-containing protein [Alteribacter populi]|uniref:CYTH domain-containing protein n=1 Tax=Alteribacter populi TaxID=2011011 RepID=UPI000BBA5EC0|nr:CYTH domain-containing protein [Alteribacter populi]